MDSKGNVVQKLPSQYALRLTTWKIVYDLLKSALLEHTEKTQNATYKTRRVVQDIKQAGEKVKATVLDLDAGTTAPVESDLLIAADGAHSVIRRKLCPEVIPQYAEYVTWRGRVPESAVSEATRDVLRDRCVILRVPGGYQIS
jgi:2-polyprenyl-6-methoxyphenol hydroxylase-like FAD-dependent oxidoreductase